jgi:hypothetical protein
MTIANGNRHVNPITAFVIRREESNYGLPDGEVAVSFIALGYGDDVDGEQRLWNTFSLSETACLDAARAAYPASVYIGRELPVMGGRL